MIRMAETTIGVISITLNMRLAVKVVLRLETFESVGAANAAEVVDGIRHELKFNYPRRYIYDPN